MTEEKNPEEEKTEEENSEKKLINVRNAVFVKAGRFSCTADYIDSTDIAAPAIFEKHGLRIKLKGVCDDYLEPPFLLIRVKIRYKYLWEFLKCMEELRTRLLILKGNSYEEVCEKFIAENCEEIIV